MRILILLLIFISINAFAKTKADPLKYTKKHFYTSHKKLKEEGMGRIPFTKIKIIPAAPSFMDMGFSMMGSKSKESLLLGIKDLGDSAGLIKKGSKKSWELGRNIYGQGLNLTKRISKETHKDAKGLLLKSWHAPWQITKYSYLKTERMGEAISEASRDIREASSESSQKLSESIENSGKISAYNTRQGSSKLGNSLIRKSDLFRIKLSQVARKTNVNSKRESKKWKKEIIKGGDKAYKTNKSIGNGAYSGLSKKGGEIDKELSKEGSKFRKSSNKSADSLYILIGREAEVMGQYVVNASTFGFKESKRYFSETIKFKNLKGSKKKYSTTIFPSFSTGIARSNKWRKAVNRPSLNILKTTISDIPKDLNQMSSNLSSAYPKNFGAIGLFMGTVTSLGYLVKGIAFDSILKPIGKAGLGLVGVGAANLVVYPVSLIANEGASVTMLGANLIADGSKGLYDATVSPILGAGMALGAGATYVLGQSGVKLFEATKYPAYGLIKATAYTGEYANIGLGKISKYSLEGTGRVVQGGSWLMGGLTKVVSYPAAFLSEGILNGGGKLASAVQNAGAHTGSWAIAGSGYGVKALGVVTDKFISGSSYAASRVSKYSILGVGHGISYLTYLGKPLTYALLPATGAVVGTAVGIAGAGSSVAYYGVGQSVAGVSYLTGTTLASGTVAGGAAITTAYTGAAMTYDVAKGMTMATGALTGGGLLLSYGTVAHAGAHVGLAVGEAAYSIASLEFPNYVFSLMKKSDEIN